MANNNFFGEKIRLRRTEMGISQADLAKAIGRTHATISDIERGKREINMNDLSLISNYLNVPINFFFEVQYQYNLVLQESRNTEKKSNTSKSNHDLSFNLNLV